MLKEKILKILKSETGSYIFFGLMTTAVNYASFILFLRILGYENVLTVNTISFVIAVVFAYITNKIFVFHSKAFGFKVLLKEFTFFIAARIFSFLFEQVGLYISTDMINLSRLSVLGLNGLVVAKLVLSCAAVLLNWVCSKFLIFKSNK